MSTVIAELKSLFNLELLSFVFLLLTDLLDCHGFFEFLGTQRSTQLRLFFLFNFVECYIVWSADASVFDGNASGTQKRPALLLS